MPLNILGNISNVYKQQERLYGGNKGITGYGKVYIWCPTLIYIKVTL